MFDLEKAIRGWRRDVAKHEALEDGLVADLELHLRDEYESQRSAGLEDEEAFRVAVGRVGTAERIASEYDKNRILALDRRAPWRPARFMPGLLGNYLKAARRRIWRSKGYSFINIVGLALALSCFALLMMWVRDEVGWDRFHEKASRIYRLEANSPALPAPLAPHLKANYPEIADAVRLSSLGTTLVRVQDRAFEEAGFVLADPSAFDIFTIPFVSGNRGASITDPDTVVLTESSAKKYFGDGNPVGRVLTVEDRIPVRVTGVVQDPPRNSDIQFSILGNFVILRHFNKDYESSWGNHAYSTYVELAPSAAASSVTTKIARVILDREPSGSVPLTMTALGRIHLFRDGAIDSVIIFSLVAILILLVAACNFVNLATARSGQRAKEIAIRKVVGAVRPQLVQQHLGESILLTLVALVASLVIAALSLASFNDFTGKDFRLADLLEPDLLVLLLGTALVVGILSGTYPALLLSALRPSSLLKGAGPREGRSSSGSRFRRILVVTQFSVSIVLMISTLLIARQVAFVVNYDLGIQKENIVYLPAKSPLIESREAFVRELTSQPGIVNATFVSSLPSQVANVADGMEWEGMEAGLKPSWAFVATDDRYLDTLGLTLVEGRNFPEGKDVKDAPCFIINQKAAAEMKLENPVGARFSMWGWNGTVLGVVKDFHFRSLHEDIAPLLMFVMPYYNQILVKIQPAGGPTSEVLARIQTVWEKFAPGIPFSYEFLGTAYGENYQSERRLGQEFRCFTALGMLIACLGLFGLAAASAEQRRKEIGVRRVFGATTFDVLLRFIAEFAKPVAVANLIAWPVASWAMSTWMQRFAYRTTLSLDLFVIATLSTLLVALVTVSYQTTRAARANPVESLKYE